MNGTSSDFLRDLPAMPPPPGVASDFDNPPSLALHLIVVNAIFLPLMAIIVGIRMYVRVFIANALGWDDYTCVGAALFSIAHTVMMLFSLRCGYGTHLWDIRAVTLMDLSHIRLWSSLALIAVLAVVSTKLSICFLYLRIFGVRRAFSICVKVGIWFCVIFYTAALGLSIAQMTECPRISSLISPLCAQTQTLNLWQAIVSATTDMYLLVLPLAPISHLQMRRRKKFGVYLILSSGFVSLAMSIAGTVSVGIRLHSPDVLYYAALSSVLATMELNIGIIAASMFAIPQFYGKVKQITGPALSAWKYRLISVRSRSRSSDHQNLNLMESEKVSPHVKTDVLGSVQGNGKFMTTNTLGSASGPVYMGEEVDGSHATARDEWERLA